MSYAVYSTRGWILGSAPSGEASKIYLLYTEDFGLIHARAQSVRLLSSKLRYSLEDYSFGTFSLVRGKEVWRLTGSERSAVPRGDLLIRARILNLVKRLVQGEERNDELFAALLGFQEKGETREAVILSRILGALGYLDLSALGSMSEREMIREVNKALKETQL